MTTLRCRHDRVPVLEYGLCSQCGGWYATRRDGRVYSHRDCPSWSLYRPPPRPERVVTACRDCLPDMEVT